MADRDSGSLNINKLSCEIAKTIGLGPEPRTLRLGESFTDNSNTAFHTFRYDFKPASVDTTKMATVEIGPSNQTTVQVPHVEGSGMSHTIFKGPRKPYTKECVLIIDHATGDIVLERLNSNVQLKKTRAEASGKFQPRSTTPVEHASSSRKVSPFQSSPSRLSLKSPASQRSPSMPCLIPPTVVVKPVPFVSSMPLLSDNLMTSPVEVMEEESEAGILSDNSSGSSTSESSDSESDQDETVRVPSSNVDNTTPISFPSSMPYSSELKQLNDDLQLSESESDG